MFYFLQLFYCTSVLRSEDDTRAYLEANKGLLEKMKEDGSMFWRDYRMINFDNEYRSKTQNLIKDFHNDCAYDIK